MQPAPTDEACFVLVHGNDWSLRGQEPNDYIAKIVYGEPKVTTAVVNGHFVALCEYPRSETRTLARTTMERMGSFSYGAALIADRLIALREFGCWVYHYAGTKVPASV